jgi:hypothetical protein
LSHRRFRDEEGVRDFAGFEAAEQSEGQRDLRVWSQGRVAAEEHEPQLIVGHYFDERVKVVEVGGMVGFHVVGVKAKSGLMAFVAGRFPSQPIYRPVAGRGDDPATRVRRDTAGRPVLGRDGEGLRHRILGEVDVTEDPDQSSGAPTRFPAEYGV